jgi:hypothetical protein
MRVIFSSAVLVFLRQGRLDFRDAFARDFIGFWQEGRPSDRGVSGKKKRKDTQTDPEASREFHNLRPFLRGIAHACLPRLDRFWTNLAERLRTTRQNEQLQVHFHHGRKAAPDLGIHNLILIHHQYGCAIRPDRSKPLYPEPQSPGGYAPAKLSGSGERE